MGALCHSYGNRILRSSIQMELRWLPDLDATHLPGTSESHLSW